MSKGWTSLEIRIAPRTIAMILGVVAGIWLLQQLTTVLVVVTVALVTVGTLDPLVTFLERRGLGRGRALVLVFLVLVLLVGVLLLLMVPPLITQLLHLIEDAPKSRERAIASLHGYSWGKPVIQAIHAVPLDNLVVDAGNAVIGYSSKLLELVGYGMSTMFLAAYLLADPVRSKGLLYAVVPRHHHLKLARILLQLKVIVGGYMRGQLITSLAIGVFVFVLLLVIGVDDALPIALFAAMTDIIPFVGGYIASGAVIASVSPHGTTVTIVTLVLMILYQEFESRILVPRVYGRVLRLPPAVVLVSLLVGGTLAGVIGALLALPIAAGVQMLVKELRVDLPGEVSPRPSTLARDERASELYEQLTENIPAADAGVIADNLAQVITKVETRPTAERPVITVTVESADAAETVGSIAPEREPPVAGVSPVVVAASATSIVTRPIAVDAPDVHDDPHRRATGVMAIPGRDAKPGTE